MTTGAVEESKNAGHPVAEELPTTPTVRLRVIVQADIEEQVRAILTVAKGI